MPAAFAGASTLWKYSGMRAWVSKLSTVVEQGRELRALFWQVRTRTAAQDQHVDAARVLLKLVHGEARGRLGQIQGARVATGVDTHQFHIRILRDRALHAASQISVACNADADL